MRVIDFDKFKGVIVKIIPPTLNDHGSLFVWQEDKMELIIVNIILFQDGKNI